VEVEGDWVFVTLGPLRCVLRGFALGLVIVTRWSGPGGIEASLSGQLVSFSALTLLVGL